MLRRLGGSTGDTAGASIELIETLLLVLAVMIGSGGGG
jgi:cobalamin synthase